MTFRALPERVLRYTQGMPPGRWADAVNDFGFVGDGATDNSAAWMAFNEWCRAETLAGRTAMVLFPPTPRRKYVYDASLCMGTFLGIRDLIFYAPGAAFQNTYGAPDRFLRDAHWTSHTSVSLWTDLGFGDPIDTMRPGSVGFTLKDPLRATGRLKVGDRVLVGSRDDQFYGYPPNIGQREFRRIASRHMTGGALDAPVAFHHRDDFPDGMFKNRGGRARIWQLDDDLGRHGTEMTGWSRIWDINHVPYGGTVLPGANALDPDHYVNIIGKRVVYVDFTRPGISQMTNGELILDGCHITTRSEPDKNCDRTIMRGGGTCKGNFVHQSESIGDIDVEDWSFTQLVPGAARTFRGRRLVVAAYAEGLAHTRLGMSHFIRIEDSTLLIDDAHSTDGCAGYMVKLDKDVSYDGVLGALVVAIDARRPQDSNMQEGQQVYFVPESGVKLEQNMMRVEDTREVGGRRLVFVSGGPAAVPAWATHIAIIRRYHAEYINCTGSERALSLSLAYERGRKPWEWTRNTLDGASPKSGRLALSFGKLRELSIDVLSARERGTLTLDCNPCQTEEFTDGRRFRIVIDLTVAGIRTFRLAGTEMLGADEMTLGGTPIADLPAGRVMAARLTRTLSYALAPGDPTIRVDMEWDRGTVRTLSA